MENLPTFRPSQAYLDGATALYHYLELMRVRRHQAFMQNDIDSYGVYSRIVACVEEAFASQTFLVRVYPSDRKPLAETSEAAPGALALEDETTGKQTEKTQKRKKTPKRLFS